MSQEITNPAASTEEVVTQTQASAPEAKEPQAQPQASTPESKPEDKPQEEQTSEIDPESPFAPFQELRAKMVEAGVDFTGMDAKVQSLEPLSDDEIQLVAQHSGHRPEDVKAYLKLAYDTQRLTEKAQKVDQDAAEQYLTEINEIAGGSYEQLKEFIAANADASKIKIWNAALAASQSDIGSGDPALQTQGMETQKEVLREMQAFRVSKDPSTIKQEKTSRSSDLSLLAQAANKGATTTTPAESNPLEGNPLAHLAVSPTGIQHLTRILLSGTSTEADKAHAKQVLEVIAPHLV